MGKSKQIARELYSKDLQQKHEIYEEFLQLKHVELNRKKGNEVDDVDVLAVGSGEPMRRMDENRFMRWLLGRKRVAVSREIDEMPFEQRKALEQKTLGDTIAVNYDRYPFKQLARKAPQWFTMKQEKVRNESDTAQLVSDMKRESADSHRPNLFEQDVRAKGKDLRILS